MAGTVKGITVEIGGDTSKLGKALESSEKQSRDLQKELKQVNTALKFNPGNVELLAQKQKLLAEQIQATKEKLDTLRAAEAQVEAQFNAGEIGEEQFRAFQREIIETESKLKNYQSQLEATGKKASALDELTNTISDQEKAVDQLKEEYKEAVLTYGKNSDEAKKLANEIDSLSSELKDNKTKMSELDKAADELDNSLDKVEDSSKEASGGFTVMKGALANLVAQGITKAIGALKDLASTALDAYKEFDEGQDNVIKATGATGEAAAALSESYKKVAKSVVGDMSTIGSALGEVNTRFGWTGEALEDATTQFMKFSDITGVDAVSAVQLVSRAMEGAKIDSEEYSTVLDQLAVAGQASGTSVEKLAENLTKFGTPMREMGLSTSESIAMLAQFEKSGVNIEVALGGMRKALQNWTKDGKVASKEFGKVLDQIKKAPNSTKATEIAMENFGNKAGPELAEAIREGRFEWSDFMDLVEGSAGAVTNTYEETQDGFDKINLAVQGVRAELGDFVGQLLTKYQPQIQGAIDSGVNLFKTATQYVVENFDKIKTAAEIIIPILASVFAVNKIAGFISSLQTLSGAFTALWGVMAANPLGLMAIAAGALVAGIVALNKVKGDAIEKTYGLNNEEQALINKINEEKTAIEQATEARKEANAAIDSEYGQNQKLWDELQEIVDANGEIKKGYEDRAAVITGLLSDSLGIEIEIVDGQIQKYDELKTSIEDVIRTKRAEALLEANKEAYSEAISKSAEAYTTYTKALQEATNTQAELTIAEQKAKETRDLLSDGAGLTADQISSLTDQYLNEMSVVETLRGKYDEQNQAVKDAESNYFNYASTIQNYEGVMAAMASGDVEVLGKALDQLSNNFLTAETATKSMLENQLKDFKEQYANMKTAVENGMPGVNQASVDAMGQLVKDAETELNKLTPKAKTSGKKAGDSYAGAVKGTAGASKKAGVSVATDTATGMGSKDTKAVGTKKGNEYASGVSGTAGAGKKAGENVAKNANTGMGTANTKATGTKKGTEFSSGVNSTSGSANSAGRTIANSARSGAGSVSLHGTGSSTGSGYVSGVSGQSGSAYSAGNRLASNAKSGASSVSAYSSGSNFGQGFINGIGSKLSGVLSAARNLASSAINAVKNRIQEGSPSKITTRSGGFFGQGFINGIIEKIPGVAKAAREMAGAALSAVDGLDVSSVLDSDLNGLSFDRQLENTFNRTTPAPDFSTILAKLDTLTQAVTMSGDRAIVLDTGVLVGQTAPKMDAALSDIYGLKARGV